MHEPDAMAGRQHRRRWPWLAAALAVSASTVVLFWFQPQKLFIDDRVDEALPSTAPDASDEPVTASEPIEIAQGEFVSLDHTTGGVARVLELADGRHIVRLEGFNTDNGPDLYLYLSTNPAGGDEGAFDDDYIDLGRLKGNQGDQNYDLPADTDLSRFSTVVIWCDRFNSAFGAADLA